MRTLFCTQNPSSRAACHGNPSLGPVPPYFTFRPVLANQLKAPWSPLCFHQVRDGGYGVLFLNCSRGHVALLLKSPQRLSPTRKGQTGPRRYQVCTGRSISGQPALCFYPRRNLASPGSFMHHLKANALSPRAPGKMVFLLETGTASLFLCYFISPLFFDQ